MTILLTPLGLPALATVDLKSVLAELENREKTLSSVKFEFHQEIEFTDMGSKSVIEGEALFAKPGKMKISKTLPEEQLTVSNGKKLWVYSPKNAQVWQGPVKTWTRSHMLPPGLVPLSDYVAELKKNFNLSVQEKKNSPEEVSLKAVPKKDWGYQLEFDISKADWLPNRTVYVSDSGRIVTTMKNRELNPSIQDKIFEFSAPQGTDVIQLN